MALRIQVKKRAARHRADTTSSPLLGCLPSKTAANAIANTKLTRAGQGFSRAARFMNIDNPRGVRSHPADKPNASGRFESIQVVTCHRGGRLCGLLGTSRASLTLPRRNHCWNGENEKGLGGVPTPPILMPWCSQCTLLNTRRDRRAWSRTKARGNSMKGVSSDLLEHYAVLNRPPDCDEYIVDVCVREFGWFESVAAGSSRSLEDVAFAMRGMGEADAMGDVLGLAGRDADILLLSAGTLLTRDWRLITNAAECVAASGRVELSFARAFAARVLWHHAKRHGERSQYMDVADSTTIEAAFQARKNV